MRVYRLLSEEELNQILDGNVSELGNYFDSSLSNTHEYKPSEKYLHFFFKKSDCEYIKSIYKNELKMEKAFLAEFKIPLAKIIGYIGKGFYIPQKGGYDVLHYTCYEIALPVSIFNPTWMKRYEEIFLDVGLVNRHNQPQ